MLHDHDPDEYKYRLDVTFDAEGDFWVAALMYRHTGQWREAFRGMGGTPAYAIVHLGEEATREIDNNSAMLEWAARQRLTS